MRFVRAYGDCSGSGGRNAHRLLTPYHPPQFKILTPEQAEAQLRDKALPGDAMAQQLLKIATRLTSKSRQ